MTKPITPRTHGFIDYGFAVGNLLLPTLLRTPTKTRAVFAAFGVIQGTLNALTVQPLAFRKDVPFRLHGLIEKNSTPLFLIAPLIARTQKNPKALTYWVLTGVALVVVYNLTDWNANNTNP